MQAHQMLAQEGMRNVFAQGKGCGLVLLVGFPSTVIAL